MAEEDITLVSHREEAGLSLTWLVEGRVLKCADWDDRPENDGQSQFIS